MAGKRSYEDGCLAAQALEHVGERWALLVVRELLFGPRRFTDLLDGLRTISPNVLTQRLADLEAAKLIVRRRLEKRLPIFVYALTPQGAALEPVLIALGQWSALAAPAAPERPVSAAAAMLVLKSLAQPLEGPRFDLKIELDDQAFHLKLGRQRLRVGPWEGGEADATLIATPVAFDRLVRVNRDLADAVRREAVAWRGERKVFDRLMALTPPIASGRPSWEGGPD